MWVVWLPAEVWTPSEDAAQIGFEELDELEVDEGFVSEGVDIILY